MLHLVKKDNIETLQPVSLSLHAGAWGLVVTPAKTSVHKGITHYYTGPMRKHRLLVSPTVMLHKIFNLRVSAPLRSLRLYYAVRKGGAGH